PQAVAESSAVGSQDTTVADPAVRHPHEKPIVVTLFSNMEFADFNVKSFTYTPPGPGPWAKVILVGDFNVTAGVQYDRTCQITLGHVNILYGTTPEPSSSLGPTWHVERDLTDYTALFESPQSGEAILGNLVNSTYTGVIYGTVKLEFYPASGQYKAPKVPDEVLPFHDASGGAVALNSGSDALSQTFTLPTNIEKVYMDLFAQGQSNDEFWYTCVPSDVSQELQSCGATGFREVEVTVDGQPAGVAPVYPWIFTGGIDPFLWAPIPGVQTLNFVPYRVDLTPFAGLLDDGNPHTIALSVYNADQYFLADAALLLYLDKGSQQVTGAVTQNTLTAAPNPTVTENLTPTASGVTGTVSVASARNFEIAGYVQTSHGKVKTTVQQTVNFSNAQQFTINNTSYIQDIKQATEVTAKTTTKHGSTVKEAVSRYSYPLTVNLDEEVQSDGSFTLATAIDQRYKVKEALRANGESLFSSSVSNEVTPKDTLLFDASGNFTGHQGQASEQRYRAHNSSGWCYGETVKAADNAVTRVKKGGGCP
ncbi:MAG: peptide-N4-asparagine amidase, partial [Acidobacteriota bacterium]